MFTYSSPYRGDEEANRRRAARYCAYAINVQGAIPIAPHLYVSEFLPEHSAGGRERAIELCLDWMKTCDELWVAPRVISAGMEREIHLAGELGLPLYVMISHEDVRSDGAPREEGPLLFVDLVRRKADELIPERAVPSEEERVRAVDMIRHIAAAHPLTREEINSLRADERSAAT